MFVVTGSLEEAAGVCLDAHNLEAEIYEALMEGKTPLFAEKMEMMVHGRYRGVRIRRWIPGRKKMNSLRIRYPV